MATELDRAYAECQQIARSEAKNFYYAFRTLPAEKRRAIHAAYAFCRICDDIADDHGPTGEKQARFDETRRRLRDTDDGRHEHPVFLALSDAISSFDIPLTYFEEVIDGVEMDLTRTRYRSFDELREYCYKVASVIGLISIEVFGYEDAVAREYAVDLGLAMQLTNILRDIKEDGQRGRIYLPLDELERFGHSEEDLNAGVVNDAFRSLMRFQVERARGYFASGRRLAPLVAQESRACPRVLADVYSRILDRIEAADYNVFQRRIGLSAGEKFFIMAKLWTGSLIRLPDVQKR
jgi:phytoene synthase